MTEIEYMNCSNLARVRAITTLMGWIVVPEDQAKTRKEFLRAYEALERMERNLSRLVTPE